MTGRFRNPRPLGNSGAAAAEMALVLPLLITILFGSAEMGNYFLQEHAVAKSVRDGARFAARLPMTDYTGCSATPTAPTATAVTKIRNVTRTGSSDGTGIGRLSYWAEVMGGNQTITVTATCDNSGTYTGIYDGLTMGAPVVTVSASVPYPTLFGMFGMISTGAFKLNASSQAAVMGI